MISQEEKDEIILRYSKRFKEFGVSPKALGWDKGRHNLRFAILLEHWNLSEHSILDVGCGLGYMYEFIKREKEELLASISYTGADINPELIEASRRRFPGVNFITEDLISDGYSERVDFIFASGLHNLRLKNCWEFTKRSLEMFHETATCGFAVNFLSDRVDFKEPSLNYTDPSKVLDLCYRFSNRVVLRNDYMPYEFSLFVDKREQIDAEMTVYTDFLGRI